MPNWCSNKLIIHGEPEVLDEIRIKLSTPYTLNGEVHDSGAIYLWNIVSPTDLDAYNEVGVTETDESEVVDKAISFAKHPSRSVGKTPEQIRDDAEQLIIDAMSGSVTGDDWYGWNVRNWGTKWDITDSIVTLEEDALIYSFATAYAPPVDAIANLAQQYPSVRMIIGFMEENAAYQGAFLASGDDTADAEFGSFHEAREFVYNDCYECEIGKCDLEA